MILFALPCIYYQPDYQQLKEAEITIEWTHYNTGRGRFAFIRTTDDSVYRIGGALPSRAEFEEALIPNSTAKIKYYRGLFVLVPMNNIEELTVNGTPLVTYQNQQKLVRNICAIAGSCILIIGFMFYADSSHLLNRLRKKYREYNKKHKKQSK